MGRNRFSPEEVEANRARIVRAAESLFAERGFEGVTLRSLAEMLGQSPTAAYRYFDGKAAIFTAARIAAYQRFAEAQEQAARESDEPAQRLSLLGTAYTRFALEEPDAYRLMFELKQPLEGRTDALREAEVRAWTPLRDGIGAAVEASLLEGDPDSLAHLFWAGLHGIASLHLAGKLSHGLGLEELCEPMKQLLFVGGHLPSPS
jgi:AcrR family transcriptional regulator